MPPGPLHPSADVDRLKNLDVLRALALLGVLLINLVTEFRVSIFSQFLGPATGSAADVRIDRALTIFVESKAFVLFSLLFGVGLAIQLDRSRAAGRHFRKYVLRRLGLLLVIGLVHLVLVWNGDILTEYAVAGLLFAPLVMLPAWALLALWAGWMVLFVLPVPYPALFPAGGMASHLLAANQTYAHGTFIEVLSFRVHELRPMLILDLTALPRTLALFALGAWIWRAGIFQQPRRHPLLLGGACLLGIPLGALACLTTGGALGEASWLGAWRDVADSLGSVLLAFGYAAAFVLLFELAGPRALLSRLAPLGRMALTNYLAQSLVLGWVFYGYGLGCFGSMRVTTATLLGLGLYVLQAVTSDLWLRYFRLGPMEWVWRSGVYGAWQPLLRRTI